MATTPARARTRTRKRGARGSAHTTRTVRKGDDESTVSPPSREFEEEVSTPDPAYVSVGGGLTKNMGDYNSVKISVSVTLPCDPDEDSVRECYEKTSKLVDEFLDDEYAAAIADDDED